MFRKIIKHVILPTGLHAITTKDGRIHILSENEYEHAVWFKRVLINNNLKTKSW
jgi:hypothetical protein